MLNFIKAATRAFKILPWDSNRRARLKLLYLVPFIVLMFPLRMAMVTVMELIESCEDLKNAWNHKPSDDRFDALVGMLLRQFARGN